MGGVGGEIIPFSDVRGYFFFSKKPLGAGDGGGRGKNQKKMGSQKINTMTRFF